MKIMARMIKINDYSKMAGIQVQPGSPARIIIQTFCFKAAFQPT